jgi:integrase/recombinase XerD
MPGLIEQFADWLDTERAVSDLTVRAYEQDVNQYLEYLASRGILAPDKADSEAVISFLTSLAEFGMAPSSIRRKISSIRAFYRFVSMESPGRPDPTALVVMPRMWRRVPRSLTVPEIESLVAQPDTAKPLGIRDKAMLEFTYATGMRVSEVTGFLKRSLNLELKTARCMGKGSKERIVPVGEIALRWIGRYIDEVRPELLKGRGEDVLFLNWRGRPLSRVGFWKILKGHARSADIEHKVTPHVLRHSFATHLLEGGAGLREVQVLLGHENIATTQIYTKTDMEYLRSVIIEHHPRGKVRNV